MIDRYRIRCYNKSDNELNGQEKFSLPYGYILSPANTSYNNIISKFIYTNSTDLSSYSMCISNVTCYTFKSNDVINHAETYTSEIITNAFNSWGYNNLVETPSNEFIKTTDQSTIKIGYDRVNKKYNSTITEVKPHTATQYAKRISSKIVVDGAYYKVAVSNNALPVNCNPDGTPVLYETPALAKITNFIVDLSVALYYNIDVKLRKRGKI